MSNVKHGKRLYKQMALEVGVRNPERYIDFLKVFSKYEGRILDDKCILDIYVDLYMNRVLDSNKLNECDFNEKYLSAFIVNNLHHNNEWGFPTGYQAAFCRYLKTLSEFGFIYSQYNETFKLSEVAKALVSGRITSSEAFSIQSMRYWRKSPYRRVLNDFNYFKFIVDVLLELEKKGRTLSMTQFMVSLFSMYGNVDDFIETIELHKFGNDEDKAYEFVCSIYDSTNGNFGKVAKQSSAFRDYGNSVFRVLQLTGFITVNSSGIITLSINKNRLDFYKNLCTFDFSLTEDEKESELMYFEKIGTFDDELFQLIKEYREKEDLSTRDYNQKIKKIIADYSLNIDDVGKYLEDLSSEKKDNRCFWYIQSPLKLEFLLTIYVYLCYGDQFEYRPNFKCDDNGIPYSHAPGNVGDIEVFNRENYWLIEATLIRNKNQQINAETMNLFRHLTTVSYPKKYMTLVAPYIHEDTSLMIKVASIIVSIERQSKIYANTNTVSEFIENTLYQNNFMIMEGFNAELINSIKRYCEN